MVAYNFKARFAEPIRSGEKRRTIRRRGKRRHAAVGERLQLYTGLRTKAAAKIIEDPICELVAPVTLGVAADKFDFVIVGGEKVDDVDAFAVGDGFKSAADMHAFWLAEHGVGVHEFMLIGWGGVS